MLKFKSQQWFNPHFKLTAEKEGMKSTVELNPPPFSFRVDALPRGQKANV